MHKAKFVLEVEGKRKQKQESSDKKAEEYTQRNDNNTVYKLGLETIRLDQNNMFGRNYIFKIF